MANEATNVQLMGYPPGEPLIATVAAGTAISKGTWLVWNDEKTVVASSGINQSPAGIAAFDKNAQDTSTTMSVYTNFVADVTAVAGTVNLPLAGYPIELSGANLFRMSPRVNPVPSGAEFISGAAFVAGKSLANASASEVFQGRFRL